jgi:hypothetical protein
MSASEIPLPDSPPSSHRISLPESNGHAHAHDAAALADELANVKADRAALEGQYSTLLGKLTTMRSSIGERLKQDAVESPASAVHVLCVKGTCRGRRCGPR